MEIDIHTHVFNCNYWPLEGILRSRGVIKPLAAALAAIFEWRTKDDPLLQDTVRPFGGNTRRVCGGGKWDQSENATHEQILAIDEDSLIDEIADSTPRQVFLDVRVARAARFLRQEGQERIPHPKSLGPKAIFSLPSRRAQKEFINRLLKRAIRGVANGARMLKWLWFVTQTETSILETLKNTYGAENSLYVHLMMDLDNHYYGDRPKYVLSRRVELMRRLGASSEGLLIGFYAFDPYRAEGVQLAQQAVSGGGFCGIKFYPPNGYRPTGNSGKDELDASKGVERPIPGTTLDQRNAELFEYCECHGVPLITHCSPGGFERVRNYTGKMSDPKYWNMVLEDFPELPLCLGHAGGGEGWFADGDEFPCKHEIYAKAVHTLCTSDDFPNVVCDFSYLDEILSDEHIDRLKLRLERLLDPDRTPTAARFGASILYGSDWHMLYKEMGQQSYEEKFRDLFKCSAILRDYKNKFFHHNALRFLNLERHLIANSDVLSEAEIQRLQAILAESPDISNS